MSLSLPLQSQAFNRHTWLAPLLISLLALLAALFEPHDSLAFRREWLEQHQYYRLLSANFLHTNDWHLLINLAGLWLIYFLFNWSLKAMNLLWLVLILCLLQGLGLYWFFPELNGYVGLSGVLHGLFAYAALQEALSSKQIHQQDRQHTHSHQHTLSRQSGWLLLAACTFKVGYEQLYGASEQLTTLIHASVAIDAHLVGAISGILLSLSVSTCRLLKKNSYK